MADLVIFPQAFIDRLMVCFSFGSGERQHLVLASIGMWDAYAGAERHFEAAATNPERALQDLREQVEAWQRRQAHAA